MESLVAAVQILQLRVFNILKHFIILKDGVMFFSNGMMTNYHTQANKHSREQLKFIPEDQRYLIPIKFYLRLDNPLDAIIITAWREICH